MKPAPFNYIAAQTIDQALHCLSEAGDEAKILAGGQSLGPMLNLRLARPSTVIDINPLEELANISIDENGIRIGALVRHHAIETSSIIADRFPLITAAARHVAHPTIRNRGTFVGSLAHNDPAAEWPLIAQLFDAEITVRSLRGERKIHAKDFFESYLTTTLEADELITSVYLPFLEGDYVWGFEEMSRRLGDFALAAVGVLVQVNNNICQNVRIALAGVDESACRATQAEQRLSGQQLSDALLDEVAEIAAKHCDPPEDLHASAEDRKHLVRVLTKRALKSAWNQ